MSTYILAASIGGLLSFALIVRGVTGNPFRIPIRQHYFSITVKYLAHFGLFLGVFCGLWALADQFVNDEGIRPVWLWCRAGLIGFLQLKVIHVKGFAKLPRGNRLDWVYYLPRLTGRFFQQIYQFFYIPKFVAICSEQRILCTRIANEEDPAVIEYLFTIFSEDAIAKLLKHASEEKTRHRVVNMDHANFTGTKVKALMFLWGYPELIRYIYSTRLPAGPHDDQARANA